MNKVRPFKPCVRKFDGLLVVFWKKDTVYLIDEDHKTIIDRWWSVRNSYTRWKRMCRSYKYRKSLNYGKALGIAIENGFCASSARHVPDYKGLPEFKVKEKK